MTTRFKTSLAAGLVAVTLGAGGFAVASASARDSADRQDAPQERRKGAGPEAGMRMRGPGGPGGPGGFGLGLPLRELNLTEDQQAQLRKIREARQDEFRQAGEKVRTARDGMRALIEAERLDEGAIRARSAEVAAAEAEIAILNAKVRQEAMQILTSEQQQKLKELQANRRHQPMKRRGPGGQR
jgi:Spy/CpxP family protein refolding chaperone